MKWHIPFFFFKFRSVKFPGRMKHASFKKLLFHIKKKLLHTQSIRFSTNNRESLQRGREHCTNYKETFLRFINSLDHDTKNIYIYIKRNNIRRGGDKLLIKKGDKSSAEEGKKKWSMAVFRSRARSCQAGLRRISGQ